MAPSSHLIIGPANTKMIGYESFPEGEVGLAGSRWAKASDNIRATSKTKQQKETVEKTPQDAKSTVVAPKLIIGPAVINIRYEPLPEGEIGLAASRWAQPTDDIIAPRAPTADPDQAKKAKTILRGDAPVFVPRSDVDHKA